MSSKTSRAFAATSAATRVQIKALLLPELADRATLGTLLESVRGAAAAAAIEAADAPAASTLAVGLRRESSVKAGGMRRVFSLGNDLTALGTGSAADATLGADRAIGRTPARVLPSTSSVGTDLADAADAAALDTALDTSLASELEAAAQSEAAPPPDAMAVSPLRAALPGADLPGAAAADGHATAASVAALAALGAAPPPPHPAPPIPPATTPLASANGLWVPSSAGTGLWSPPTASSLGHRPPPPPLPAAVSSAASTASTASASSPQPPPPSAPQPPIAPLPSPTPAPTPSHVPAASPGVGNGVGVGVGVGASPCADRLPHTSTASKSQRTAALLASIARANAAQAQRRSFSAA